MRWPSHATSAFNVKRTRAATPAHRNREALMSATTPIIELRDVSFAYSSEAKPALSHVSLSIAPGEFVGVIGSAGSGKSTLMSLMSGAIPHHYTGQLFGAVLVDGRDTCEISLTDISRTVGSVLQDIDAQMVAPIVEDELLFGLENYGVPHDQIEERIAQTLATVGISDLRHREIATLSGGQKQKVAIAAILALAPRVLVLDEPTAALDPASSKLVYETLRQVNRQAGITVVVVEQKVALQCEYCDRILIMGNKQLAFDGEPHEVFSHAAKLREMGIDSPRVARMANSLVADGLLPATGRPCLNVAEAKDLVAGLVAEKGTAGAGPAAAAGTAPTRAAAPATSRHMPAGPAAAATGHEPVIELTDVTFSYGPGAASVNDLNMKVYPGELVGVIGQNGAGKTTLTKLLNGLLRPSKGSVYVAGMNTREVPTSKIAAKCATLFQNPDRQICKETVLEEIAFGLELHGTPAEEARRRAAAAAERFGLDPASSPFSLSRGKRQLVALASVVVLNPQVVLLDEPTSGLDYRECMTVMETVREMAERGCAVVMVCHDMEVVSDFAQRLVVMAQGRILAQGAAADIFANDNLMAAAYVAPPQVIALTKELARDVSPVFDKISEVGNLVDVIKEMVAHD